MLYRELYPSDREASGGVVGETLEAFRAASSSLSTELIPHFPAHSLTFLPPLRVVNLLPCDADLQLSRRQRQSVPADEADNLVTVATVVEDIEVANVTLKPNGVSCFNELNPMDGFGVKLQIDRFPHCLPTHLVFPVSSASILVANPNEEPPEQVYDLILYDELNRQLRLQLIVRPVLPARQAAMQIAITAPFWILNCTGLPLLVRQAGAVPDIAVGGVHQALSELAAGQFQEHESARSLAPLLFNFPDPLLGQHLSVRIGRGQLTSGEASQWSEGASIASDGFKMRNVYVARFDMRPARVFTLGIEITAASGALASHTKLVKLLSRYELRNHTDVSLVFAQRHLTIGAPAASLSTQERSRSLSDDSNDLQMSHSGEHLVDSNYGLVSAPSASSTAETSALAASTNAGESEMDASATEGLLELPAGAFCPFHWVRFDLDQVCCIKIKHNLLHKSSSQHEYLDLSTSEHEANTSDWSGGFRIDQPASFFMGLR